MNLETIALDALLDAADYQLRELPQDKLLTLIDKLVRLPQVEKTVRYIVVNEDKAIICDEDAKTFYPIADAAFARNYYADDNDNPTIQIWVTFPLSADYLDTVYAADKALDNASE